MAQLNAGGVLLPYELDILRVLLMAARPLAVREIREGMKVEVSISSVRRFVVSLLALQYTSKHGHIGVPTAYALTDEGRVFAQKGVS